MAVSSCIGYASTLHEGGGYMSQWRRSDFQQTMVS